MIEDFAKTMQAKLSDMFPNSHVRCVGDHNFCSGGHIQFSLEPKAEWVNGIFYNAKVHCLFHITLDNARFESELTQGHLYDFDSGVCNFPIKVRNKNRATLEQIEKHVSKIFADLKAAVEK